MKRLSIHCFKPSYMQGAAW